MQHQAEWFAAHKHNRETASDNARATAYNDARRLPSTMPTQRDVIGDPSRSVRRALVTLGTIVAEASRRQRRADVRYRHG
jgi:hypothetical protein